MEDEIPNDNLEELSIVEIKIALQNFYAKHNPEKLENIPFILDRYKGREVKILRDLEVKYNINIRDYFGERNDEETSNEVENEEENQENLSPISHSENQSQNKDFSSQAMTDSMNKMIDGVKNNLNRMGSGSTMSGGSWEVERDELRNGMREQERKCSQLSNQVMRNESLHWIMIIV